MLNQNSVLASLVVQDALDETLLDSVFGVTVAWHYPGVPFYYPPATLEGVVVDVRTRSNARQLLVRFAELNIPKWIDLNQCQFVNQKAAAA